MVLNYQGVHFQAFGQMVQEVRPDICAVLDMGLLTSP